MYVRRLEKIICTRENECHDPNFILRCLELGLGLVVEGLELSGWGVGYFRVRGKSGMYSIREVIGVGMRCGAPHPTYSS